MSNQFSNGLDQLKKNGFYKFENVLNAEKLSEIFEEWNSFTLSENNNLSVEKSDEPLLSLFNAKKGGSKVIRPLSEFKTIKTLLYSNEIKNLASAISSGASVRLLESIIFSKEPNCNNDVCWHVDESFFPLVSKSNMKQWFITFWMPLKAVTKYNGHMEYIAGSHEITQRGSVDLSSGLLIKGEDRPAIDVDGINNNKYKVLNGISNVGDVLVHFGNTWHRSTPNITSDQRRPAISFKFIIGEINYHKREYGNSNRVIFNNSFVNGDLFEDITVPNIV